MLCYSNQYNRFRCNLYAVALGTRGLPAKNCLWFSERFRNGDEDEGFRSVSATNSSTSMESSFVVWGNG